MNDVVTTICYGAFFLSTVFTLRRVKYSWLASVLAGLVSPLAFIVLFAMVDLPCNILAGKLRIPENVLPGNFLTIGCAVIVVMGWFIGGLLLTRKKKPPQTPNSSCQ